MDVKQITDVFEQYKSDHDIYHQLMPIKTTEILLVASMYDSFILQREGSLYEQIFGEYYQLNLSSAPRITSADTNEKAIKKLKDHHFDIVILMEGIHLKNPQRLAKSLKKIKPEIPILLLLNNNSVIHFISGENQPSSIDRVFVWNGESRIFVSMIKYIEDKLNVKNDTKLGEVRVILLIEDSIRYYSRYLPVLYTEILQQTQHVIEDEHIDQMQKLLRMRARPKVILVSNFEDAVSVFEEYKDYLLCVISDVEYRKEGKNNPRAGIEFMKYIKKAGCDIPFLLQSSGKVDLKKEELTNVGFIDKNSNNLSSQLHEFIRYRLGFGDFIFKDAEGREIGRASNIDTFKENLRKISADTLVYHGSRNEFSAWLMARGEIHFAKQIRRMKVSDFETIEDLRKYAIDIMEKVRLHKMKGKLVPFDESVMKGHGYIIRMAEGSLGGKGRGIAFSNTLIEHMNFIEDLAMKITIPDTAVIGTNEFETFINANSLHETVLAETDYEVVKREFLRSPLSSALVYKLRKLISLVNVPLAVRSSGLFEDMLSQPFAGIYSTFILPNNHPDATIRLQQLTDAIKLIYASIFSPEARVYFEAVNYKIEEEKMAVIIQKAVGGQYGDVFYPQISGTAQSYNYYPVANFRPREGIASIAVGLGSYVVDGEQTFQFCPVHPKTDIAPPETLSNKSQQHFYAIDMSRHVIDLIKGEDNCYVKIPVEEMQKHGTLHDVASTFDLKTHQIVPGTHAKGPRIINFANIIKHNKFPLAETIHNILKLGEHALAAPVEIEYAVHFDSNNDNKPTFYLLQLKPVLHNFEEYNLDINSIEKDDLILYSKKSMGNGKVKDVMDIIFVNPDTFDKTRTLEMVTELGQLNTLLKDENRKYILIGPGRWGSRDRFLGIPVNFAQISHAKILVEAGLEGYEIDASLGSHFFHNITSMNIGYMNIPFRGNEAFIDWKWLKDQKPYSKTDFFIHIRTDEPLISIMDGKKHTTIVNKPGKHSGE